jgi:CRP-like cAMP-binding protein
VADANLFLRHLSVHDFERLLPDLQRTRLNANVVVTEDETIIGMALLPIDCILSVITVTRDGRQVESRTIGRESGFGLLHALGSPYSYEKVLTQVAGEVWSTPLDALYRLATQSPSALKTIAAFAQATIIQSTVSVACNALHKVEHRLARWLLITQDRLQSDVVPLTQEHLSIMLAVQRTTVTAAAIRLQNQGLISYSRGRIRVLDRDGLIRASCECYEQMEDGVRRLTGERIIPG